MDPYLLRTRGLKEREGKEGELVPGNSSSS